MSKKRGQHLLEYGLLLLLLMAILMGSLGLFGQTTNWLYSNLNQNLGGAAKTSLSPGDHPTAWPTVSFAPSLTPPPSEPLPSGLVACQIKETFTRTVAAGWGNLSSSLAWVSSNVNYASVVSASADRRYGRS
jgi:Flp pilus assembly pilin Flp